MYCIRADCNRHVWFDRHTHTHMCTLPPTHKHVHRGDMTHGTAGKELNVAWLPAEALGCSLCLTALSHTFSLSAFYFWSVAMWLREMSNKDSKQVKGCSSEGEKMTDPAASTSASQRSLFRETTANILLRKTTEEYMKPLNHTVVGKENNSFPAILLGLPSQA